MTQAVPGINLSLQTPFDAAILQVTAALKVEGFGVLTRIDVHETFMEKLGVEFPRYTILGACNPVIAHRALSADPSIGLLLPCNVVVREVDGGTEISMFDPFWMAASFEGDTMKEVADEAGARLHRVAAVLRAT